MTSLTAPLRVLIIDDDEGDYLITRDFLEDIPEQKLKIDWCDNYKEGSKALLNASHDIYFVDYFLGAKTGIDLLREAIASDVKQPVILLTGQGNRKVDMEAMKAGAFDYLAKSELTAEKLERCIRYSLERAANLKELRANERQFRTIFERSKDVIFIADKNLHLKHINPPAHELLGYSLEEILKKSLYDLMPLKSEKEELAAKLIDSPEIIDFQAELQTRDQLRKNCILSASRETDSLGNPYIQGIIRDISLLKKAEEIKLQSEKLEAKGMVIRTLAHEIRNPLHNITLALGYLKNEVAAENQEFLNVIDRNSKRINGLINELMDSNQFYKMKLQVTPLQTVVEDTIKKAMDRITLSRIKVNPSYPDDPALVLADREKLKIAFLNIVINAVEAMEEDKGELSVSIASSAGQHSVTFTDNGCGMSADDQRRLFEPYFTNKPKGLGLGLAATYAIVQSHKADIQVSSELAKGTSFTISFPSL